jgi:hypothetical protein
LPSELGRTLAKMGLRRLFDFKLDDAPNYGNTGAMS